MMPERLGNLVVYSVKEGLYDVQSIVDAFENNGITTKYIPNCGDEVNSFKMACSLVEKRWKKRYASDGSEVRIKISSVQDTKSVSVRTIVQERVRSKSDYDGYESNLFEGNVFKLVLKKDFDPMIIDIYTPESKTPQELVDAGIWADGVDYGQMVQEILETRNELRTKTYAANVRTMIVDYLKYFIGARPFFGRGGVYFGHKAKDGDLARLVKAITEAGCGSLMSVSLYDENGMKQQAKEYFSTSFISDIESIVEDIDVGMGMRSNKMNRIEREILWFENLAEGYASDGIADMTKIKIAISKARMKFESAKTTNEIKKVNQDSARIRREEQANNAMKTQVARSDSFSFI